MSVMLRLSFAVAIISLGVIGILLWNLNVRVHHCFYVMAYSIRTPELRTGALLVSAVVVAIFAAMTFRLQRRFATIAGGGSYRRRDVVLMRVIGGMLLLLIALAIAAKHVASC
jgi:hypothetical protein